MNNTELKQTLTAERDAFDKWIAAHPNRNGLLNGGIQRAATWLAWMHQFLKRVQPLREALGTEIALHLLTVGERDKLQNHVKLLKQANDELLTDLKIADDANDIHMRDTAELNRQVALLRAERDAALLQRDRLIATLVDAIEVFEIEVPMFNPTIKAMREAITAAGGKPPKPFWEG